MSCKHPATPTAAQIIKPDREASINDHLIAIMRLLCRQKNGAVSDAMQERAASSHGLINYGVSVPTIRDAVQVYATHPQRHRIAGALWNQDVRELRLAALFVEDPALVSSSQAEQWSLTWESLEMAEQSAAQLLCHTPQAADIAIGWIRGEHSTALQRMAAYLIIGRLAATGGDCLVCDIEALTNADLYVDTTTPSAVVALREIYRHHPALRPHVLSIKELLPDDLKSELEWQVEYLKGLQEQDVDAERHVDAKTSGNQNLLP